MTQEHLRKLWLYVGLLVAFYSFNTWLSSQGMAPVFNVTLLDTRPVVGALFGVIVCSILLVLEAHIGIRFARLSGASRWHARMPLVLLTDVDTNTVEGKIYQGFFLCVFVVIPAASLFHFMDKVRCAKVVDKADLSQVMNVFSTVAPARLFMANYWDDGFRIGASGGGGQLALKDSVTWFPIIEPIVLCVLVAVALWYVAKLGWSLLNP